MIEVHISRVSISSPNGCQVITEKCNDEAYWFVGTRSMCDKHMKQLCNKMEWDYDELRKEGGL